MLPGMNKDKQGVHSPRRDTARTAPFDSHSLRPGWSSPPAKNTHSSYVWCNKKLQRQERQSSVAPAKTETSLTKVICQLWTRTANKNLPSATEKKVKGMEVMMLNFGAAARRLEPGPNKNISSACQAMRWRPIDLWEFPICQRQAAY